MRTIVFSIIAVLCCSCGNLLEEKPQAIAVETFYNTIDEVEAGIGAVYLTFRSQDIYRAVYLAMQEVSSDQLLAGRASWAPASEYQGLNGTAITRVQGTWNSLYLCIRNANILIQNVPNSSGLNETERERYVGEARFLRALAYFQLVRNWGDVPLRTENNVKEINVARSSVEDIYNLIQSDLQCAEEVLPDEPSIAGRASKWAAKTVLADVYFYQDKEEEATQKSNEVIQSGKYSLVEVAVATDFDKVFGPSVTYSTEEILYFKWSVEDHWEFMLYFHGVKTPYLGVDGYYAIYSNENYSVYKNQDDKDLRKTYNWYSYDKFDEGTILCKKFSDPGSRNPANDYPAYRYTDCLLIYAEASCRAAGRPTVEGLEALNKVHRRAYGYPSVQSSPVDFKLSDYDKESFIALCMKERGYETVAEGKRWLDLKRSGLAVKYVKENRGQDIAEKHYLWPIPVSELNYNEAITDQNPGY